MTDWVLIRCLDKKVLQKHPRRRGWFLIDARPTEVLITCVHARPYLDDGPKQKGFRTEPLEWAALKGSASVNYVPVIILKNTENLPPQSIVDLLVQLEMNKLPWMCFVKADESDMLGVPNADRGTSFFRIQDEAPYLRQADFRLGGNPRWAVKKWLPFEVAVSADRPKAAFTVGVDRAEGFSRDDFHFLLCADQKSPIARGRIRVDARLHVGESDEIRIEPLDFATPLSVESWAIPPVGDGEPVFHDGPLVLHLLYDRTTLDAESWSRAFAPHRDNSTGAADDPSATDEAAAFNQNLRGHLARALAASLNELHSNLTLHLWWFADVWREGMAPGDAPFSRDAVGEVGACSLALCQQWLQQSHFNYRSGFDFFDALDEALEQVKDHIISRQGDDEQHAVLIVGDSPPPPSDESDLLWKAFVEQPTRTSARRSPRFGNALRVLRDKDVPVGWLFVRTISARGDDHLIRHMRDFEHFQSLKERLLGVLLRINGLAVESCAIMSEMERPLSKLLRRMARSSHPVQNVQVLRK